MKPNATTLLASSDGLPSADQERLARILDDYLVAIERGAPISPEELLARHPDDAEHLRGYLSGLRLIHAAGEPLAAELAVPHVAWHRPTEAIGDFHLIREIGRGGMGIVYEAWQATLKRRVALKVLPFTSTHDAKHTARFKNEAQAAAQVQHPNIVPVFAVGEHRGVHYYAMQLVSGRSLNKLLDELRGEQHRSASTVRGDRTRTARGVTAFNATSLSGNSPVRASVSAEVKPNGITDIAEHVRTVARMGIQAAEALHAAHEFGVIHRDVKPSNLLLDEHGKLWITDFGLARCRENDCLTQTGDILGTMRYMSPEQALGRTTLIDHRTDVYSLGVTLYEFAALVHPTDVAGAPPWHLERGRPNFKPLRHWNRQIPVDFQTIVMKAVSEFPQERYQTAGALAEDLKRFSEGRAILASPPTVVAKARKWATRHRQAIGIAAAVAFVAMFAHALLLTREQAAKQRALESAQASRQEAHAVLDRFGAKLVDQLAAVPGAEGVRKQLLQDSLEMYERLAVQAGDDAALRSDMAMAYGKAGGLAEQIGDEQQAIAYYRSACQAWRTRIADEPDNVELRRNLAACQNSLAMLLSRSGDADESRRLLQEAYDTQRRLLANEQGSSRLAVDIAVTHNNLGLLFQQDGRADDALRHFQAAVAVLEPVAASTPAEESVLRGLAASYNNLSSAVELAEHERAVDAYEQAIAIQLRLLSGTPASIVYQSELARTYNNFGYLLSRMERWPAAEQNYVEAIRLQQALVKAAPLVVDFGRDLAVSYNNLGMAQCKGGHLPQSESSFQAAIRLQQRLLEAQPTDGQLLSDQGNVYNNLGQLHDLQQRFAAAEAAYAHAVHHQRQALEQMPGNTRLRALLNRHFVNYAASLRSQNKHDAALRVVHERRNLWQGQPTGLQSVAVELATACRSMRSGALETEREAYASAAVDALREALAAGMPPDFLNASSLAEISDTAPFRQLLMNVAEPPKVVAAAFRGSIKEGARDQNRPANVVKPQLQGTDSHGQTN